VIIGKERERKEKAEEYCNIITIMPQERYKKE